MNNTFPTVSRTGFSSFDQNDYDELVDFSIYLGQHCWNVYRCSKVGFVRIFLLPSEKIRSRANELFLLGFSARMVMCPTANTPDADTEEIMWESYLDSMNEKIVLDGPAYPETPKVVLDYAKNFFLEGFRAGTIAVREIFNS